MEHASIQPENIEEAIDFYTDGLGLVEIAREDGTVYLGTSLTENFELAVTEGRVGIEHVAVRADNDAVVDDYENEFEGADVETSGSTTMNPASWPASGSKFRLAPPRDRDYR
ncbi:VOC family protein [Haloferax sp. ATB1]|uniref:VOC family protein n=1 Tax=Haloferax sp. ATB1 TaxID=1508454 RepID=UPI00373FD12F